MEPLAKEIRSIIDQHMVAGEVDGGAVLVSRHGRIVALEALGTSGGQDTPPLGADTVFAAFSLTKPVTAACVALLITEGAVSPDDEVARYIPEFAAPRQVRTLKPGERYRLFGDPNTPNPSYDFAPADRPITVQDLLTFSAGLQTIGIDNAQIPPPGPQDNLASWVAKLGEAPLEFQPGTKWAYSNSTAYDVLGRIVEVASGQTFDAFTAERLLQPLGMSDTGFGLRAELKDRVAPMGPMAGDRITRTDFPSGSAGLFTTLEEYWRFAQVLLDDGMFEGRQILPAAAVEMMRRDPLNGLAPPGVRAVEYANPYASPRQGLSFGYGLAIISDPVVAGEALPAGSFGWDGVGTRRFWAIPALDAVLLMHMPGIGSAADPVHRAIETLVANRFA